MAILTVVLIYFSLIMSDAEPRLLPRLPQQCGTRPLRVSSCQSPLSSPRGPCPFPRAWTSTPSPTLCCRGACESLLDWEVLFSYDLHGEPSLLRFPSSCFCIPLWGLEAPPLPCLWGGFLLGRNFSSFIIPAPNTGPHPEILCLSFFYLLPYLVPRWFACLLGSLGLLPVFCRSCSLCR